MKKLTCLFKFVTNTFRYKNDSEIEPLFLIYTENKVDVHLNLIYKEKHGKPYTLKFTPSYDSLNPVYQIKCILTCGLGQ